MPAVQGRTPREIVDELCEKQGRKLKWLAEKAGMSQSDLTNTFAGRRGYNWTVERQTAIADALGVPYDWIWGDAEPEPAAAQ